VQFRQQFPLVLSVKKEAKLSAREREITGVEEGSGEEDFRCKSLYRAYGLPEALGALSKDDETRF